MQRNDCGENMKWLHHSVRKEKETKSWLGAAFQGMLPLWRSFIFKQVIPPKSHYGTLQQQHITRLLFHEIIGGTPAYPKRNTAVKKKRKKRGHITDNNKTAPRKKKSTDKLRVIITCLANPRMVFKQHERKNHLSSNKDTLRNIYIFISNEFPSSLLFFSSPVRNCQQTWQSVNTFVEWGKSSINSYEVWGKRLRWR